MMTAASKSPSPSRVATALKQPSQLEGAVGVKMRILSEDEFVEIYAQKGGCMVEYEDVKDLDCHVVWTEVEDLEGNGTVLLPGFHFVNRVSYLISEKPWTDEDAEQGLEVQWCVFGDDEYNDEYENEESV
jgi:hypothetical protein